MPRVRIFLKSNFANFKTNWNNFFNKLNNHLPNLGSKKLEKMRKAIADREADILKLRQEINSEKSLRATAEFKITELEKEIKICTEILHKTQQELLDRQQELFDKTSNLFELQEILEVNKTDIENFQRLNKNLDGESIILKEENAKVLTEFFLSREENNKLAHECKNLKNIINDQNKELEHLSGTLSEMKTYYLQRDLKSEATQSQYKKLIDYLQKRVDELATKKKKTLTEMIFGSNSSAKKENIPPIRIEDTEEVKKLQTDLKRERTRSNTLKEQLLQAKTDIRKEHDKTVSNDFATPKVDKKKPEATPKSERNQLNITKPLTDRPESNEPSQMHRFEMTLQSATSDACAVCSIPILGGNSHWKCKECKISLHRKCRGNAISFCGINQVR